MGIIDDAPSDILNEDLLEGLSPFGSYTICNVERLRKHIEVQGDSLEVGLDRIKIFCKGSLPSHVDLFGVLLRVYPFVAPVLRCFNCQLFGHGTNFCSNKS